MSYHRAIGLLTICYQYAIDAIGMCHQCWQTGSATSFHNFADANFRDVLKSSTNIEYVLQLLQHFSKNALFLVAVFFVPPGTSCNL